jgi:hypothetical protein
MELNFADAQFEITEEELGVLPKSEVPSDVLANMNPPVHNSEPPAIATTTVATHAVQKVHAPPDLDDIEMDVRYTLHQIGADLGEPIDIGRVPAAGQIVVRASLLSLARQKLLVQLLQHQPCVELELEPPVSRVTGGDVAPSFLDRPMPSASSPEREAEQQRLAKWFGDLKAQENFTHSVLITSTDLLARLYAIKQLSDRWSPEGRSGLSRASQEKLATMVKENASAATQLRAELALIVKPLIDYFSYPAEKGTVLPGTPSDERDTITAALEEARDEDLVLRSVLATQATTIPLNEGLLRIQQDLEEVERDLRAITVSKP